MQPSCEKLKDAGAVLLGKLNMHEFAYGATSVTSFYSPVTNPWAADRIAGGSSGGSAAAVAAGLCYAALGSDTGGSIREPCSFCRIVSDIQRARSSAVYNTKLLVDMLEVLFHRR